MATPPDFELTDVPTKQEADTIAQQQKDLGAVRTEVVQQPKNGKYTVRAWYQ
jgi:hypothetical protein